MEQPGVKDDHIELVLNDIMEQYGYDFSEYSRASLKRRINRIYLMDKFPSFAEFRHRVKTDSLYLKRFVEELTVNVTEMFRDPAFYKVIRTSVLPVLATYPLIRIWHAGCSTGEEVYSMAIMLQEANLLHKSIIYATDLNPDVLDSARRGHFPLSNMKTYSQNYIEAGGQQDFSFYYSAKYNLAKMNDNLKERMVYATHNLVSDNSFNEFQLIFCRNVLIYFDPPLQNKVFNLFDQSLENLGFLALGAKETLRFSSISKRYSQFGNKEKIWRKTA